MSQLIFRQKSPPSSWRERKNFLNEKNALTIEHVEIVQGAASALYGMNAINGLANFTTKDPFTTPGFSVQQQIGINHVNDPNNISAKLYNGTNVR